MVQAVLQILERPYYQLQETPAGLEAQVPSPVWQGLQAATALRRLLHPSRLLPQQAEVCANTCPTCGGSRFSADTDIAACAVLATRIFSGPKHALVGTSGCILTLCLSSHNAEVALSQSLSCEAHHIEGGAFI